MNDLRDPLHVYVEFYDAQEESDVGYPYYVASFVEIAATTDRHTLDELIRNIHEVIDLYLETQTEKMDVKLAPNPRVVITLELPHFGNTQ
jgi:predicted RNase H-like HicB family nuclease